MDSSGAACCWAAGWVALRGLYVAANPRGRRSGRGGAGSPWGPNYTGFTESRYSIQINQMFDYGESILGGQSWEPWASQKSPRSVRNSSGIRREFVGNPSRIRREFVDNPSRICRESVENLSDGAPTRHLPSPLPTPIPRAQARVPGPTRGCRGGAGWVGGVGGAA